MHSRTHTVIAVSAAALAATVGIGQLAGSHSATATTTATTTTARSAQAVDPHHYMRPRANPWFPLEPGTVTVLRGTDEGHRFRERVHVTHRTRTIEGVRTRVVRDVLRRSNGTLAESTTDWYAADNSGNVWYFGENTATYDRHGHVDSREGTWRAGVHGAKPGMIMPAHPRATDAYRQEFFVGHAEDQAWIVGFKATVRTPMRRFRHVLRTFEWSRLEPDVVSSKLYARGIGIVREHDVAGGSETFSVVSEHRP